MRAKKLQGSCITCKTVVDMKYRSTITELGLNKARASKTNTSNLGLKLEKNLIEMILIIILLMKNALQRL